MIHLDNQSLQFCILILRNCNILTKISNKKPGALIPIDLTDNFKKSYDEFELVLKIPDIDTNKDIGLMKNRVITFFLSLLPSYVVTESYFWSSLIDTFPYIDENRKINCDEITNLVGMTPSEFMSQRHVDIGPIEAVNYDIIELERHIEKLRKPWKSRLKPIQVGNEIKSDNTDKLLYDFISRCQYILLEYKYWEEYWILNGLANLPLEQHRFRNLILPTLEWYSSLFGPERSRILIDKAFDRYTDELKVNNFDTRYQKWKISRNLLKLYDASITASFGELIEGKRYERTRNRYGFITSTLLNFVIRFHSNDLLQPVSGTDPAFSRDARTIYHMADFINADFEKLMNMAEYCWSHPGPSLRRLKYFNRKE